MNNKQNKKRKNTVHAVRLPCANHARRRVRNVDCIYISFVLISIITQKARETVSAYRVYEVLRKPFESISTNRNPHSIYAPPKHAKGQYALSMPRSEIHSTSIQCPTCFHSMKFLRFHTQETSVHRRLLSKYTPFFRKNDAQRYYILGKYASFWQINLHIPCKSIIFAWNNNFNYERTKISHHCCFHPFLYSFLCTQTGGTK